MKAERWQEVKALLEEVLEAGEDRRESLLDERCTDDPSLRAEVAALLAADERATSFMETPSLAVDWALHRGKEVGPYRILRLIGEGGMGVVYEAEQAKPVRRKVALKFVKPGMDTRQVLARFDAERQALALMSHPSIARVYDAGATDAGRPYFVMEYVPGVPVAQHCDTARLSATERLLLFVQICEGVHHAHQKGIIHRDIKPSNVLVTLVDGKPVPKIIDFGVAKATERQLTEATFFTELGQAIGTPEYMSPEQTETTGVDVDIRTDVYSLGILLYELLTGVRPFDFRGAGLTFDEMRRRIREEEPTRPSTRARQLTRTAPVVAENRDTDPRSLVSSLRGDLDWITLKALEKDRARRYASVSELVADIERHLKHQPVLAAPPRTSYRVGKFVRRHRMGVAAAAAVVVALLLGLTAAGVGLVRAQRAEARARQEAETARQEAETARQVSDFLVELFKVSDPGQARGSTVTAREILDRGAEKIQEELQDQPVVKARLMSTMGRVHRNLGLLDEAGALYRSALEALGSAPGERDLETAEVLTNLGFVEIRLGRNDEAERLMRRSLDIRTRLLDEDDPRLVEGLSGLAQVFSRTGQLDEARRLYERALQICETQLPPDDPKTAVIVNDLAIIYAGQDESERAMEMFRRALAMGERTLGQDHPLVGLRLTSLGMMSRQLGQLDDAERYLLRSLEVLEKVLGKDHHNVAFSLNALGGLCAMQGRRSEAASYFERALEIREKRLGESSHLVAEPLLGLAELLRDEGRDGEAEESYRRAVTILDDGLGPEHARTVSARESYAAFLREQGREEEAARIEAPAQRTASSS